MHKFALYSPLRNWQQGEMPVGPFVSLALGTSTSNDRGSILLTSQLMTEEEVDREVDGLIRELEEFRRTAKIELKTLLSKMLGK